MVLHHNPFFYLLENVIKHAPVGEFDKFQLEWFYLSSTKRVNNHEKNYNNILFSLIFFIRVL